ncbi:hypothetical protein OGAPHI_003703 [Ogataea philodendri]|uniref:Cleavage and polyadenylation specificity factor subunit 2 n=1 Tax=Ogataea philodendri TaxID=1378263 RepID=A0A9P8P5V9_9ASCO|nr:uncharacterized protein OGAPHI_003703 [Ogataea philodendri]KAH3665517.1 hypothetical protein OGAPHI_003703 [Ogataea philodendri]
MFEFVSLAPPVSAIEPTEEPDEDSYDPLEETDVKSESGDETKSLKLEQISNTSKSQARLLTFDGQLNILADPGWDGVSDLQYLEPYVPNIHLIILSQTTVEYLGAFAYLLYKYPILRRVKTYSTLPVSKLGRLATIELYRSVGLVGALKGAILEVQDVENYFNSIVTLNYSQSVSLTGNLSGITITAYNSGHTLGGSFWLLNKDAEKIVYAPTWNHSKDFFLNPGRLNQTHLMRATTLISGSDLGSSLSHKMRINKFLELVQLTLMNGTSILLPTTITGRLFELFPLLDHHVPPNFGFYLLSFTGKKSLEFSGNMLEWMSPDITKNWENQNQTPFESNRLKLVSLKDLNSLEPGPKIIFVDGTDMEAGSLSRECFMELCSKHNTALLMTERPAVNTTAYEIYQEWERQVSEQSGSKDGSLVILDKKMSLSVSREDNLRGSELTEYKKSVEERRHLQKEQEVQERMNNDLLDTMIGEEDDDDDDDNDNLFDEAEAEEELETGANGEIKTTTSTALTQSTKLTKDEDDRITVDKILQMPMDFDVRNAKGRNRMFPFIVKKVTIDDYGEVIKHSDFMREEEKFPLKPAFEEEEEEVVEEYLENGKRKKRTVRRQVKKSRKAAAIEQSKPKDTVFNLDPLVNPQVRTIKPVTVDIRCGLAFLDLSGLADLRSMRITFNSLKPRKVILLPNTSDALMGGSVDVMKAVMNQQKSKMMDLYKSDTAGILNTDYLRPKLNEKIDLGNVVTSYDLVVSKELDGLLNWQTITGGYSIAHVFGEILPVAEGEKLLKLSPPTNTSMMPVSNYISIGDIRLTELRRKLTELNHVVEFRGDGTLVVNNQLAVRKISDGNLVIDGGMSPLFYQVRGLVQDMLAYV